MKTRIRRFLFHLNSFITRHQIISGLVLTILLLLLIELTTRLLEGEFSPFTPEYFQYNPHTLWDNKPEFSFTKQTGAGTVRFQTNQYGFRAREFQKEKPPATTRIFCLGDSTTWGYDIPFEAIYPDRLNQRLGEQVQVISAGVMGYTIAQCRIQLETKLLAFHPDIITVASNYNDRRYTLEKYSFEDPESLSRLYSTRRFIDFLSRISHTVHYIIQFSMNQMFENLRKNPPPLDTLTCRVPLEHYRQNLEQICRIAHANDIKVVFIGMGDSYQNFSFLREYRTASTLDEKISILLNARREQSAGVYGLATRLLVEHLKASAGQDSGIRAEEIERVYPLRRSLDGGFIIEPDWVYRDAMAEVAEQHQIPWLDFVQYTMQFDEIKNLRTSIFIEDDPAHLNELGHSLLADALEPILQQIIHEKTLR